MNKAENYWILLPCGEDDSAVIADLPKDLPEGSPEWWELTESEPVASRLPDPVKLRFSDAYPDDIKLYDFVDNMMSVLIISERVKKSLIHQA